MIAVSLVVLIPIILVIFGSFKTVNEFFATPYGLPEQFDFFNYRKAWDTANLQRASLNSLIATSLGVFFSTILACLASYGLARFDVPRAELDPAGVHRRSGGAGAAHHHSDLRDHAADRLAGDHLVAGAGLFGARAFRSGCW